jgi:hypothetical protein
VGENANNLSSDEQVLADVIDRIAAKFRRGETVDLDAYIREYPACAERLPELYPALELVADLSATTRDASASPTKTDASTSTAATTRAPTPSAKGGSPKN